MVAEGEQRRARHAVELEGIRLSRELAEAQLADAQAELAQVQAALTRVGSSGGAQAMPCLQRYSRISTFAATSDCIQVLTLQ